jgi:FkbM family methyltransferase
VTPITPGPVDLPASCEVVETPLGTFACPSDAFADHLRDLGGHQRPDIASMAALVAPGDLVLDVGGFIGTVAVPLARAVGPTGRVVSFEAMPDHVRMLRHNLAANGVADRAEVVHTLISPHRGRVSAHRLEVSAATTWYEVDTSAPAAEAPDTAGASVDGADVAVGTTTVDAWLAGRPELAELPVSLLKVDVEGMELDVLRGAEQLLARHHPALQLEVARYQLRRHGADLPDLQQFLTAHGYRCYLNLTARDTATDTFTLGRLADLRLLGDMLTDVLAVHRDSPRSPGSPRWLTTQATVLRHRGTPLARRVAGRARRALHR